MIEAGGKYSGRFQMQPGPRWHVTGGRKGGPKRYGRPKGESKDFEGKITFIAQLLQNNEADVTFQPPDPKKQRHKRQKPDEREEGEEEDEEELEPIDANQEALLFANKNSNQVAKQLRTQKRIASALSPHVLALNGPEVRFFVAGTAVAQGWNQLSDERLKQNIRPFVESTLPRLLKLVPKQFEWKECGSKSDKIGFIAQEVAQLFPRVVTTVDGYKSIDWSALVTILIRAVQEIPGLLDDKVSREEFEAFVRSTKRAPSVSTQKPTMCASPRPQLVLAVVLVFAFACLATFLSVPIVRAIGFKQTGVQRHTLAALWESHNGPIKPGSLFASAQQVGATGNVTVYVGLVMWSFAFVLVGLLLLCVVCFKKARRSPRSEDAVPLLPPETSETSREAQQLPVEVV